MNDIFVPVFVFQAYQSQVSLIQRGAVQWLYMSVPDMTVKNWTEFPHCVYKVTH